MSKRLAAAADFVREGKTAADVACDHGKLSAFLLGSGKTPFIYATDIKKQPLKKAEELLASLGMESRSRCLLTDGLHGVPGNEVDDVIMAGIGGDLTARIISEAPWLKDSRKHLVLVPASKHERLRTYLAENGFLVKAERAVFEAGHVYTVMSVSYDGAKRQLGVTERWLGKIDAGSPDGKRYYDEVCRRMNTVCCAVKDENNERLLEARAFLKENSDDRNSGT